MFEVKFESNIGGCVCSILRYNTEEAAEKAIKEDLETHKERHKMDEYGYGDSGIKKEFWLYDGDQYAFWKRMWK